MCCDPDHSVRAQSPARADDWQCPPRPWGLGSGGTVSSLEVTGCPAPPGLEAWPGLFPDSTLQAAARGSGWWHRRLGGRRSVSCSRDRGSLGTSGLHGRPASERGCGRSSCQPKVRDAGSTAASVENVSSTSPVAAPSLLERPRGCSPRGGRGTRVIRKDSETPRGKDRAGPPSSTEH